MGENPEFFPGRNLPPQMPRLAEPDAVRTATCDGDEVSIRRSIVALILARVTPSDHGAIDSEPDAVEIAACDGDEVSIRRSVVALLA